MKFLLPFLLLLLICSCKEAHIKKEACRKESGFIHCAYLNSAVEVSVHLKDENGRFYGSVDTLASVLATKKRVPLLLMNAGMFHANQMPVGFYKEYRKTLVSVDTSTTKSGNFYLQPNGIFGFSRKSSPSSRNFIRFSTPNWQHFDKRIFESATQSGPMLLIKGKINPLFNPNSRHRQIRNAVGISKDSLHFVMSESVVTFYKLADFFKRQKCQDALYLDGYVSQLKSPTFYSNPNPSKIGPILSVWESE